MPAVADKPSPSPVVRRTRRATKMQKKKKQLQDSNTTWKIGQTSNEKCGTCQRKKSVERRSVKFDSNERLAQPNFEEEEEAETKENHVDLSGEDRLDNAEDKNGPQRKDTVEQSPLDQIQQNPITTKTKAKNTRSAKVILVDIDSEGKEEDRKSRNTRKTRSKLTESNSVDSVDEPSSSKSKRTPSQSPQPINRKVKSKVLRKQEKANCTGTTEELHPISTEKKSANNSNNSEKDKGSSVSKRPPSPSPVRLQRKVKSKISQKQEKTVPPPEAGKKSNTNKLPVPQIPPPDTKRKSPRVKTESNDPMPNTSINDSTTKGREKQSIYLQVEAAQPWLSPMPSGGQGVLSSRRRRSLETPVARKIQATPSRASPGGSRVRASPATNSPLMKKNAKGETPLHVACIKVISTFSVSNICLIPL